MLTPSRNLLLLSRTQIYSQHCSPCDFAYARVAFSCGHAARSAEKGVVLVRGSLGFVFFLCMSDVLLACPPSFSTAPRYAPKNQTTMHLCTQSVLLALRHYTISWFSWSSLEILGVVTRLFTKKVITESRGFRGCQCEHASHHDPHLQ